MATASTTWRSALRWPTRTGARTPARSTWSTAATAWPHARTWRGWAAPACVRRSLRQGQGLREPHQLEARHGCEEAQEEKEVQPRWALASRAVAKYDEQVARALAGAHNTARVAHGTPDYVRVGAGLGSAFVWALLDLADAIRAHGQGADGGALEQRPPQQPPPTTERF